MSLKLDDTVTLSFAFLAEVGGPGHLPLSVDDRFKIVGVETIIQNGGEKIIKLYSVENDAFKFTSIPSHNVLKYSVADDGKR